MKNNIENKDKYLITTLERFGIEQNQYLLKITLSDTTPSHVRCIGKLELV